MEYTESLPASPMPGLAGLKAGRLSAGRPGRLRTLLVSPGPDGAGGST